MMIYFIICNYNAQRNGSLLDSLNKLDDLKNKNTKILVWDNASSDDSQYILKQYHTKYVIDNLVLSDKNIGKSYALNSLANYVTDLYNASNDDVLVSMDSDICIYNKNFSKELQSIFNKHKRLGFIGYEYYEDEKMTIKSQYNLLKNGINLFEDVDINLDNIIFHPLQNFAGYLAGGLMAMRIGMFKGVKGYSLDTANGGKLALYGSDDDMIESKLWNKYGKKFMFLFDERKQIVHRTDTDNGYKKWKDKCLNSFREYGYGIAPIPTKGYYDKKD